MSETAAPTADGRIEIPAHGRRELPCDGSFAALDRGRVGVFLIEIDTDGRQCARHFIATLSAGGLLPLPAVDGTRIELVAAVASRLSLLTTDAIETLSRNSGDRGRVAAGIGGFVGQLLDAWPVEDGDRHRRSHSLAPGDAIDVGGQEALFALQGLSWIDGLGETSVRIGALDLRHPKDVLVPVSERVSALTSGPISIRVLSTMEMLDRPRWTNSILALAASVAETRIAAGMATREARSAAIERRVAEGREAVHDGLVRLHGLFHPEANPAPPRTAADSGALQELVGPVAEFFGLRMAPAPALEGAPEQVIEVLARHAGMRARPVHLEEGWQRSDLGPLIVFDGEERTPLALIPRRRDRYWVSGAGGSRHPADAAMAASVARDAFVFSPTLPDEKTGLLRFAFFPLKRVLSDLSETALMSFFGSSAATVVPLLSAYVVNQVIPSHDIDLLLQLALAMLLALCATFFVKLVGDFAMLRLEGRLARRSAGMMVDRVIRLPLDYVAQHSASVLALQFQALERVRRSLVSTAASALTALIFSIPSFGVVMVFAPDAALSVLATIGVFIGLFAAIGMLRARIFFHGPPPGLSVTAFIFELAANIATVKAFAAQRRLYGLWAKNFAVFWKRMIKFYQFAVWPEAALEGLQYLIPMIGIAGVALLHGSDVSVGGFVAFTFALATVAQSTIGLLRAMNQLAGIAPQVRIAKPLLEAPAEPLAANIGAADLKGGIEVSNVSVYYAEDAPPALSGVGFVLEPGEHLGIIGPSGAGKSSLVKVLLGVLEPSSGAVFYDRRDLARLDLQAVRRSIGYVAQNAALFSGTVFDNIKGASNAQVDAIWEAAEAARIADDIRAMPMGMHTVIGEGYGGLSGGQTQRIILARALALKPAILILDEATSALDAATQRQIAEALDALRITRISIAHRLETVRHCDTIIALRDGVIEQQGSFEALANTSGLTRELLGAAGAGVS